MEKEKKMITLYLTNPEKTVNFKTYEAGLEAKDEANIRLGKQRAIASSLVSDTRVRLRLRNDDSFDLVVKEARQVEVKAKESAQ